MMNGSGTQADPYLITTCQEFVTCLKTLHGYARLTKNLDCNEDGLYEWNYGNGQARNGSLTIDFNGHYLANVFIPDDQVFAYMYERAVFKNGAIVNVYEQSAKFFTFNVSYFNFALSINANTFTEPIIQTWFGETTLDYCNVRITNVNVNNVSSWFSGANNAYFATNSKINVNGKIREGLYSGRYNSSDFARAFKNCLIEGKLNGDITNQAILFFQSQVSGACCMGVIWKCDVTECANRAIWENSRNGVNIIDSSVIGANMTHTQDSVLLTDAQIRSHSKLDEIGFDTVEVID